MSYPTSIFIDDWYLSKVVMSSGDNGSVSYLALVPRGLHHAFLEQIWQQFQESSHCFQVLHFVGEVDPKEEAQHSQHLHNLLLKRKRQHFAKIGVMQDLGPSTTWASGTITCLNFDASRR